MPKGRSVVIRPTDTPWILAATTKQARRYRRAAEQLCEQAREKYHADPAIRQRQINAALARYYRLKAERAAAAAVATATTMDTFVNNGETATGDEPAARPGDTAGSAEPAGPVEGVRPT